MFFEKVFDLTNLCNCRVNISESTYDLLRDSERSRKVSASIPLIELHFTFESRGKVAAKGKGEMELYFVSQNG